MVKQLAEQQHSQSLAQLASRLSAVVRYGSSSGEDPGADRLQQKSFTGPQKGNRKRGTHKRLPLKSLKSDLKET